MRKGASSPHKFSSVLFFLFSSICFLLLSPSGWKKRCLMLLRQQRKCFRCLADAIFSPWRRADGRGFGFVRLSRAPWPQFNSQHLMGDHASTLQQYLILPLGMRPPPELWGHSCMPGAGGSSPHTSGVAQGGRQLPPQGKVLKHPSQEPRVKSPS